MIRTSALFLAMLLTGCLGAGINPPPVPRSVMAPTTGPQAVGDFAYCGGHGCSSLFRLGFSEEEWSRVEAVFAEGAVSAEDERGRLSTAVGLMEDLAGAKAGTSNDRGGTILSGFLGGENGSQLDCFSEASNTTIFLTLLDGAGLIRFHTVQEPVLRGYPWTAAWLVHATAVVRDTATGVDHVVDTWFFDNGTPAVITTKEAWLDGYRPQGGALT